MKNTELIMINQEGPTITEDEEDCKSNVIEAQNVTKVLITCSMITNKFQKKPPVMCKHGMSICARAFSIFRQDEGGEGRIRFCLDVPEND